MIHLCRRVVNISSKYYERSTMDAMLVQPKSNGEHPTAGIIVVGDEILKAQVKDTNSFYACSLLHEHGIKVQKVSVVRDDVKDIAKEIKDFSKRFNYVFTTGGIGPTHDDVTYEAVATAFDDTLRYHPTLMDIVKYHFGCETFPSPGYKMAYVPTKSTLKFGRNEATGKTLPYPCIVVQNTFVFPGSPIFFEPSFRAVCKESFAGYKRFATAEVYVNLREESFANILSDVVRECRNVSFGSYPECNRYYKARVTIESENEEDTETARRMFCERVPSNAVVHYDRAPHVDCLAKYEKLLRQSQRRSIYKSSLEKFVNYYRKPKEVWIYFDGSEESIVMIHLARVAESKLENSKRFKTNLHAIYFTFDNLGLGTNEFFREISERYDVELHGLECDESQVCQALEQLVESRPELRVLLCGKRTSGNEKEIYKNLARFGNDISVAMQIHFPLIDWTNEDVASFVGSLCLPYYTADEIQSIR